MRAIPRLAMSLGALLVGIGALQAQSHGYDGQKPLRRWADLAGRTWCLADVLWRGVVRYVGPAK